MVMVLIITRQLVVSWIGIIVAALPTVQLFSYLDVLVRRGACLVRGTFFLAKPRAITLRRSTERGLLQLMVHKPILTSWGGFAN